MIIIEPLAGLGNRMRAINSARALSRYLKTRCVILWTNDGINCNCRYSDLFLSDGFSWVIEGVIANHITPLNPALYHQKLDHVQIGQKRNDTGFFESLDPDLRIYIRTYDDFYPNHDYHSFIPVPHLMERIRKFTSTFDDSTVGIHIRRTDNSQSNEHSPTKKFIHYMEQEIRADPSVNFFLATDSPQEEQVMLSRFGDRIKVHKKKYSRASLAGMEDALVDMYCLAATQRLYTSWWSSFSTIASQINNRKMITVYE
jgi:hypothetical protein